MSNTVLIVLCAVVAGSVGNAGYVPGAYGGYAGPGVYGAPGLVAPAPVQDTPEVAAAKAAHFAAVAQARAASAAAPDHGAYAGPGAYAAPGAYGAPAYGYRGPLAGVPVLTSQGVPVDTPEVQAARAANAAAHQSANGGHYYG